MSSLSSRSYAARLTVIVLFAVAMGYFEAMVVVYLRELFYPGGFSFPLVIIPPNLIVLEMFREAATVVMLVCVAALAAKRFWERFGYFLILFGVWDIFFYVWLKIAIGWPSSIFDWDILFLIPLPWIGPVIAPVMIAVLMTVVGVSITRIIAGGGDFRPGRISWVLALAGTAVLLYSFMRNIGAGLRQEHPEPYLYVLLIAGLVLYAAVYGAVLRK